MPRSGQHRTTRMGGALRLLAAIGSAFGGLCLVLAAMGLVVELGPHRHTAAGPVPWPSMATAPIPRGRSDLPRRYGITWSFSCPPGKPAPSPGRRIGRRSWTADDDQARPRRQRDLAEAVGPAARSTVHRVGLRLARTAHPAGRLTASPAPRAERAGGAPRAWPRRQKKHERKKAKSRGKAPKKEAQGRSTTRTRPPRTSAQEVAVLGDRARRRSLWTHLARCTAGTPLADRV